MVSVNSAGEFVLDRDPNLLDQFVLRFVRELQVPYVIVSGYVSILFGRSRQTEDIDLLLTPLNESAFLTLHKRLIQAGFWCLNDEDPHALFKEYLKEGAIRYADKGTAIPNMELKFAKDTLDHITLDAAITVHLGGVPLRISQIELQIAYKQHILKSPKDLEDAKHLLLVLEEWISKEKLHKYELLVRSYA